MTKGYLLASHIKAALETLALVSRYNGAAAFEREDPTQNAPWEPPQRDDSQDSVVSQLAIFQSVLTIRNAIMLKLSSEGAPSTVCLCLRYPFGTTGERTLRTKALPSVVASLCPPQRNCLARAKCGLSVNAHRWELGTKILRSRLTINHLM